MELVMMKPRKLAVILFAVAVCLVVANIGSQSLLHVVGNNNVTDSIDRLFNVSKEGNLPTIFSFCLLLSCALLLALIANAKKGQSYAVHWAVLAAMFFYLCLDEGVRIHERVGMFTGTRIRATGFLYFAWVLPYGVLTAIIGLLYLRFLFHLPRRFAILFALAATLYIGAALGLEMVSARHLELNGGERYGLHSYTAMYMTEEFLEMSGAIVFLYALLVYIESELGSLRISWAAKQPRRSAAAIIESSTIQASPRV